MNSKISKQIAFAGLFSAVIIVLCLVLSTLSYTSKGLMCTLYATLIGHFYDKNNLKWCIMSCLVIVVVMTVMQGIWLGLSLYLPMILLGFVFVFTLKREKRNFYLMSTPFILIISVFRIFIYSKFIGISISSYVYQGVSKLNDISGRNILDNITNFTMFITIVAYFFGITICQAFISYKIDTVLKKRIDPLFKKNWS